MKVFNTPATYLEVLQWASSFLESAEVEPHIAKWLLFERFNLTQTDFVIKRKDIMPTDDVKQYQADIERAAEHYPPQYIVGHEWFYNRPFKVTEVTLIPRPETEEWVDRYLKELPDEPLVVADIGTGTGAIGITHKLERENDEVLITDISAAALAVAEENAQALQAEVRPILGDGLKPLIAEGIKLDVLISNPPYISESEWDLMDKSVRSYEPKSALFAQNNGLAIYEQLLNDASKVVRDKGIILLEIGFNQAEAVKAIILQIYPQACVEIWTDFNGLDRVVKAIV